MLNLYDNLQDMGDIDLHIFAVAVVFYTLYSIKTYQTFKLLLSHMSIKSQAEKNCNAFAMFFNENVNVM